MVARVTQTGAVQGASEEHNEDVQDSTLNEHRSNGPVSDGGVAGSAGQQASAVRGSLNLYEIAVLYDPGLEIDLEKATGKIEAMLAEHQAKITKTDNWGRRKLAYPIRKQEYAIYVFYSVEMPAEEVQKLEQAFNITDEIIRFLIIRPDLKAQAKAEALKAEKAARAVANADASDKDKRENRQSGSRPATLQSVHRGKAAIRGDKNGESKEDAKARTNDEEE